MMRNTQQTKIIGENLRKIRKARKITQKELASLFRVSFQQINKYEKGLNRLPVEKLFIMAQHYNIPYAAFFDGLTKTAKKSYPQPGSEEYLMIIPGEIARQKLVQIHEILRSE